MYNNNLTQETKSKFFWELTSYGESLATLGRFLCNMNNFPEYWKVEDIHKRIVQEVNELNDFLQANKNLDSYPDYQEED